MAYVISAAEDAVDGAVLGAVDGGALYASFFAHASIERIERIRTMFFIVIS